MDRNQYRLQEKLASNIVQLFGDNHVKYSEALEILSRTKKQLMQQSVVTKNDAESLQQHR